MNRELKRVSIIALLMFVTLLVSSTIIQYVQASALAADPRNARTLYESYSVERGPILVDGTPIAFSQPSDDDYKFQRVYANGPLYAPITGYIPVNGEATGLERSLNDYLSGQSSSQFFDSLNRLISGQDPMGASVEVAIDPVAQQAAWDALGDYTGAVIVTEPATGRILAMVTKPTFDPNALAVHNNAERAGHLRRPARRSRGPALQPGHRRRHEPPGLGVQARRHGGGARDRAVHARVDVPQPRRTHAARHHGRRAQLGRRHRAAAESTVTLADALRLSCNIPFAELGMELGDNAIREQAEKFGFNNEFLIPTVTEVSTYPRGLDEPADRAERVRPGRRAGDPAADGARVGGDRQRRHRDEPQPRRPDHGARLHPAAGVRAR